MLATVLVGACQSTDSIVAPQAVATATVLDGRWASSDGVFIADFQRGIFTSRYIKTNEILAQGSYTVSGDSVSLRWISVKAQQQRAADCSITSASSVHCLQEGGGAFDLQRTAV